MDKSMEVEELEKTKIRCTEKFPQIMTWINGMKVCQLNGETSPLPSYNKEKVAEMLGREGSIGLRVHGGKGWPKGKVCRWRNIRIKKL